MKLVTITEFEKKVKQLILIHTSVKLVTWYDVLVTTNYMILIHTSVKLVTCLHLKH